MKNVTAHPLESEFAFPRGTEVARIAYEPSDGLKIHVAAMHGDSGCIVTFRDTLGFRILDERELMEYWPICSTPCGWIFNIEEGGWLDQERSRAGTSMSELFPDTKEYLINGINECVSVFSSAPPVLQSYQPSNMNRPVVTRYPSHAALEQAMIQTLEKMNDQLFPIADFHIIQADTWAAVWVFFVTEQAVKEQGEAGTLIGLEEDFRERLLAFKEPFSFEDLPSISFEFDSKENVDKNYQGSYYLRMR